MCEVGHVLSDYHSRLAQCIGSMYKTNHALFSDVQLSVDNRLFHVHRNILSAATPYFLTLFTGAFDEAVQNVIVMHDITAAIMEKLLDFIYTGSTMLTFDLAVELLSAADMLQLPELVTTCCDFLQRQLNSSNCIGLYLLADSHSATNLRDAAENFIDENFIDIIDYDEYLCLPLPALSAILSSSNLRIDGEHQVLTASLHWLMHAVDERREYAYQVLSLVRLTLVSNEFVRRIIVACTDEVVRDALVRCVSASNQINRSSSPSSSLDCYPLVTTPAPITEPRRGMRRTLYVVGGFTRGDRERWTDSKTLKSVDCLDLWTGQWKSAAPLNVRRSGASVVALDRCLYVVGGENNSLISSSAESLDPFNGAAIWMSMPSLLTPRTHLSSCVLDGLIFIFGGWVGSELGSTIDVYDRGTDCWSTVDHLDRDQLRAAMGVVEHRGLMYMVGGINVHECEIKTTASYNPVTREWTRRADMRTPRAYLGLAASGRFLYAIGGFNNYDGALASVEKYSIEEDRWYEVAPMCTARAGAAVAVLAGRLYVFGGDERMTDSRHQAPPTLSTTEIYSTTSNTWTTLEYVGDYRPTSRSEASAIIL